MLREVQLAFALLEGHHTRVNIAAVLTSVLEQYDICKMVLHSCYLVYPAANYL
jgi:hypothetical protein